MVYSNICDTHKSGEGINLSLATSALWQDLPARLQSFLLRCNASFVR